MTITLNGTTGVTAAEFDGALDASNLTGALPAIDGSALTGIDTSPPTTYGAVGTYVTAVVTNNDVAVSGGSTYSGASLLLMRRTDAYLNSAPFQEFPQISQTANAGLSGTWRLMSPEVRVNFSDFSTYGVAALFVRIS